jgi:hypothetical protein
MVDAVEVRQRERRGAQVMDRSAALLGRLSNRHESGVGVDHHEPAERSGGGAQVQLTTDQQRGRVGHWHAGITPTQPLGLELPAQHVGQPPGVDQQAISVKDGIRCLYVVADDPHWRHRQLLSSFLSRSVGRHSHVKRA